MIPLHSSSPKRETATEQRFALPWPVSVNAMFTNVPGKGRVKSKAYRQWIIDAGWMLRNFRPRKFEVPVEIVIEVNAPTGRRFDLDNLQKGLLDLLVKHQVIPDDSRRWVRKISIECMDTGAPCTVIVRSAA